MAFLGSNIPGEVINRFSTRACGMIIIPIPHIPIVGLRLLLSPLGSNVVTRTACCSVGIVLPIYSTFKAIESKDNDDQQKWLLYWAAYGSFTIVETFTDKFISWFPLYYHVKFAFLVWLQLPSSDGARQLYDHHLRPFLLKHQARCDQVVGFLNSEMAKFVSNHQTEFELAKAFLAKLILSAREFIQPGGGGSGRRVQGHGAIEGPRPTGQVDDASESDDEADD